MIIFGNYNVLGTTTAPNFETNGVVRITRIIYLIERFRDKKYNVLLISHLHEN